MAYQAPADKQPNYPSNTLKGDTAAYHDVHTPRKIQVNPGDQVRPFAEIDKLLAWYYNPKHAFR